MRQMLTITILNNVYRWAARLKLVKFLDGLKRPLVHVFHEAQNLVLKKYGLKDLLFMFTPLAGLGIIHKH